VVRHGDEYLMVGEDGGIFNFSNLAFAGEPMDRPARLPASCVVCVDVGRRGRA
jgi:hypothetical protein